MNRQAQAVTAFLLHYKYLIVTILGVALVGLIGDNSLRQHILYQMEIADLREQIDRYNAQNDRDTRQLRELERNPKAIEKIARERYFMKADNEDIFVLSDDPIQPQHENNP